MSDVETRKLQEVGGGTYTVSIPKEWATDHRLEAGMELRLYTHLDGSIVVRSSAADVDRLSEATVAVDGDGPEAVRRAVRTAHAVGFETVTLTADSFSEAQRRAARSAVRGLVGTDVLAESETEIEVGHLLDASTVSVRQSVVQLQYVALSLHREATRAFLDADGDAHDRLTDRADEADRLARMVARHFSRSLLSLDEIDRLDVPRPALFDYYATARRLDTVAHQALRTARVAQRLPEPLSEAVGEDLRSAAESASEVVDDAATAVLDDSAGTAHEALAGSDDALAAVDALEDRLFDGADVGSAPAAAALARALDCLRTTVRCGRETAEIALQAAARAENIDTQP